MTRVAEHEIDPLFVERWSPRSMTGEPLRREDLQRLFEAARWAPSCANLQPWRFVFGVAGTPAFEALFGLLDDGNQAWCSKAGALLVVTAKTTTGDGKPFPTPLFDTGAAWMALALQGTRMGLVVHGMAGFDYDRARTALNVPEDHAIACMVAIGYKAPVDALPERYRAREQPNDRKPQATFTIEGAFEKK